MKTTNEGPTTSYGFSSAISRFSPDEKKTAKEVLDGLIPKHEAKKWASSG